MVGWNHQAEHEMFIFFRGVVLQPPTRDKTGQNDPVLSLSPFSIAEIRWIFTQKIPEEHEISGEISGGFPAENDEEFLMI